MYTKALCLFFFLRYTQSALIDLTCDDIATIFANHNGVRLSLAGGNLANQPAASEMNLILWDEELAEKAAKWVSTYPKGNNPDRTVPSGRFLTTESISVIESKPDIKIDLRIVQAMWVNENLNYTYGPFTKEITAPSHPFVFHYTQMIWSNSIYLGCAMSEDIQNGMKKTYIACEYGPGGNMWDQVPYKTGKPINDLKCAADEDHCMYPLGKKCTENP